MELQANIERGLVSIIIPVFNRPEMLLDAVNSAIRQTYKQIEVIIVDDGSTDSTHNVAETLTAKHKNAKLVKINNSGPGPARNAGLAVARGEFVQYLDSDDLLHPEKLKTQVLGLQEDITCGVSYCRQLYTDMQGNILDNAWMRSGEVHKTMFPAMLAGRLWGTPTPVYRRSVIDLAGPWLALKSEEDWEYDCRVASLGIKLHYSSEPLVSIRKHNLEQLGQVNEGQNYKIHDRCYAYMHIYAHASKAGIDIDSKEFRRFNRMMFTLTRLAGSLGYGNEAKQLFTLTQESSGKYMSRKIEYRAYLIGASILGWSKIGKISTMLDRLR